MESLEDELKNVRITAHLGEGEVVLIFAVKDAQMVGRQWRGWLKESSR